LVKKPVAYRFNTQTVLKLDAWNLLLKKDKTIILEEAFEQWESNQSESERNSVKKIVEELQKHQ